MSSHRTRIEWRTTDAPFTYETYAREHTLSFPGGQSLVTSAAPEYKGDASRTNPEELLVGAASSCHMLTFLAVAAKKRFVVTSYVDDAVGYLETNEERRLAVTRIELRPSIAFAGTPPTTEELEKLHELAHKNCFIASSIRASVTVLPPRAP